MTVSFRELRAQRLNDEVGTLHKQADLPVALVYPSPYHVGMSSLGYQTIYRELHALPGRGGRAGVPARRRRARPGAGASRCAPTNRAGRSPSSRWSRSRWPTSWRSPACVDCLDLAGHPGAGQRAGARGPGASAGGGGRPAHVLEPGARRSARRRDHPGRGRGADRHPDRGRRGYRIGTRDRGAAGGAGPAAGLLRARASTARRCRPSPPRPTTGCRRARRSARRTPSCRNMFLIEPERGCHRGCTYCVMRRSTNGGMRTRRAGAGAGARAGGRAAGSAWSARRSPTTRGCRSSCAALVDAGREVGISSLRADRLNDEIVGLLQAGRLPHADHRRRRRQRAAARRDRAQDQREAPAARGRAVPRARPAPAEALHDGRAAGRDHGRHRGAGPVRAGAGAGWRPRLALGIAPFVAKRNTPLDRQAFAGIGRGRRAARPACARWWPGGSSCGPPRPSGPGSSTGWPRAGFAAGLAADPGRPRRAAASPTGARPWPRCPNRRWCPPPRRRRRGPSVPTSRAGLRRDRLARAL